MNLSKTIGKINNKLGEIPEILYHGRVGKSITKEQMYSQIKIYNNIDEIKGKKIFEIKGRTNLDCAFHGFYLTPSFELAKEWASAVQLKKDEIRQVVCFKVNTKKLKRLKNKINIVPDLEWAKEIYKCRSKQITKNEYDFVYNFIADGVMADIYPKIEKGEYIDKLEQFHKDIMKEKYKIFINNYYNEVEMTEEDIIRLCNLNDNKNFQLCVSSLNALKCFEIIDIIKQITYII